MGLNHGTRNTYDQAPFGIQSMKDDRISGRGDPAFASIPQLTKSFPPRSPSGEMSILAFIEDWIPEDNLVRTVSDIVDRLDLSDLMFVIVNATRKPI